MEIRDVITKWGNYFNEHIKFAFTLSKQCLFENKPAAIREIYRLTKYRNLLEGFNQLAAKDPRNAESKVTPYNDQINITEDNTLDPEEIHKTDVSTSEDKLFN